MSKPKSFTVLIPNAETIAAMKEASDPAKLTYYASTQDLLNDI